MRVRAHQTKVIFVNILQFTAYTYHSRHYKPNGICVSHILILWMAHNWTISLNDLIRLNTTLCNTTDSVLCQRTLQIHCNYDATDSFGSVSMTVFDFSVNDKIFPFLPFIMRRKTYQEANTFKPSDVSGCGFEILS